AARVERRPLDGRLVAPMLDQAPDSSPTIDQIARAVAAKFGVRVHELRADTRRKTIAEPRHLAMHLARIFTQLSFRSIGGYFGGRDAATVRHACRAAAARLAADPALAAAVAPLAQGWQPGAFRGPGSDTISDYV